LSGPVQFLDSKDTHGIQIADVIAAAAVHVMSGMDDDLARKWREPVVRQGANGSIVPDKDAINLGMLEVQLNLALLMELHSRAERGKSLTEGIHEYVRSVIHRLQFDPMFSPDVMS
jgi:hypothetical protein